MLVNPCLNSDSHCCNLCLWRPHWSNNITVGLTRWILDLLPQLLLVPTVNIWIAATTAVGSHDRARSDTIGSLNADSLYYRLLAHGGLAVMPNEDCNRLLDNFPCCRYESPHGFVWFLHDLFCGFGAIALLDFLWAFGVLFARLFLGLTLFLVGFCVFRARIHTILAGYYFGSFLFRFSLFPWFPFLF